MELKPIKIMSQNTPSPLYLFLLRGPVDEPDPTPEQMQQIMQKWMTWIDGMRAKGVYLGGDRLQEAPAKILSGPEGQNVTDGPFVEAKEIVGGYMLIAAKGIAHAAELAKGCPGFAQGWTVEVRELYPRPASA